MSAIRHIGLLPARLTLGIVAVATCVALVLGAPVTAAQESKRLIRIDSKEFGFPTGQGKFFFALGTGGDLGKLTFARCCMHEKTTREGLHYTLYSQTTSFKGRSGTLVIRSIGHAYEMGVGPGEVWEGTWLIARGKSTGDYAEMSGGGRWIGIATHVDHSLTSRYSGYVRP